MYLMKYYSTYKENKTSMCWYFIIYYDFFHIQFELKDTFFNFPITFTLFILLTLLSKPIYNK